MANTETGSSHNPIVSIGKMFEAATGRNFLDVLAETAKFSNTAWEYTEKLSQGKIEWDNIPFEFQKDIAQFNRWAMKPGMFVDYSKAPKTDQ